MSPQYLVVNGVQLPLGVQASQAFAPAAVSEPLPLEPEVSELCHNFKLDERVAKDLDAQMKRRMGMIASDIKALWEILENARNPHGLLRVKIREIEEGTFRGIATPDRDVEDLAKKFALDAQAAAKLAQVLSNREDRKKDIRQLTKHLELSNKTSSLVMMMLKDLRSGNNIKDPEYPAAVGSYAHKRVLKRGEKAGEKERRRSRSRSRRRRRHSSSSSSPPSENLMRRAGAIEDDTLPVPRCFRERRSAADDSHGEVRMKFQPQLNMRTVRVLGAH